MKAQVETISPVKTRLSIEIPADEVAAEELAALQEIRRGARISGFRKGKAPLSMIRKRYGDKVRSDVWGRIIQRTYNETLDAESIVPVAEAEIQLQSEPDDGKLAYTAVVEVRPTVEPRGYEGLTLKKTRIAVADEDVDRRLEALRNEKATYEPAPEDHAVAMTDMATVDFEGRIDGEVFEGGAGEDRPIIVGANTFVPGFEEGLVGAVAGERRTVEVTFPEGYRAEDLAGKPAEFAVTVKEIKVRRLPDLDDDFAREAGAAENLDDLKTKIAAGLEVEKKAEVEREFHDNTVDVLLDANPFEVPPSLIGRQQDANVARLARDLAQRGMNLEAMGIDPADLRERQRDGAERAVRWAFLSKALAEAEKIEVSDDEVDDRIAEIAKADGRPESLVRSFFEKNDQIESLRTSMVENRLLERITEMATIEEVDPRPAEGAEAADV